MDEIEWEKHIQFMDSHVDKMVKDMRGAQASPVSVLAVDTILRMYMRWIHASHISDQDPDMVRASLINVISLMITEMTLRMMSRKDGPAAVEWIDDFIIDLGNEMAHDVDHNFDFKGEKPVFQLIQGGKVEKSS